ncbi:uncharacterized protein VP01_4060g3 [Puccinia sorghi]|uniref:Uncharacterized protein n=1 Tax=Puccinia sorghi TaxID=27349 RepID=A0A0L6URI7_9BASI|nr:uncharacterized protein VP01_4060g3 [Puccinia sorghi]
MLPSPSDSPSQQQKLKDQRLIPHVFASTNFHPVTISKLPPPLKSTIKAIPPSAIKSKPSFPLPSTQIHPALCHQLFPILGQWKDA